MLRGILADPSDMCLYHIIPIKVRHLAVRLDPYLVLCVLGDVVESRDMELEFSGFRELSQAGSEGEEVIACDGGGETGDGFADVVDAVALDAEDVRVSGAVDKVGDVAPDVVGELFEETLGFGIGEGTHC